MCEDRSDFVRWALEQLHIDFSEVHGIGHVRLPARDRSAFGGQAEIWLPLDKLEAQQLLEPLDWEGRFSRWLRNRLCAGESAMHVCPGEQPTAVKDLSDRLLHAYHVERGKVHLGGCRLTDFPFLRLSFAANENGRPTLRHLFVAHDGSSVSSSLVADLCLDKLQRIEKRPPRIDATTLGMLTAAGRHTAAKATTQRDPEAAVVEPFLISVVWIKHASGQLQFTIGESTTALPFSGWAKLLQAQPFVAEKSGASTFHLAATDDGCVDAFDEIVTCEQSGRHVLRQDLVCCSVTGKWVLAEFTESCPVSGQAALDTKFGVCTVCQQRVSQVVLEANICGACRGLGRTNKDDPRLMWILGEHPGLHRWKTWRLAETQYVYIAEASRRLKRLLIVVDKETLAVRHLATTSRLIAGWIPVAPAAQNELLH
ncbi:MAG: hypothetical protein MK171_01510 [Pirellulales bacterium]|nr:hypothetical protein [Pirellulales bacterium]